MKLFCVGLWVVFKMKLLPGPTTLTWYKLVVEDEVVGVAVVAVDVLELGPTAIGIGFGIGTIDPPETFISKEPLPPEHGISSIVPSEISKGPSVGSYIVIAWESVFVFVQDPGPESAITKLYVPPAKFETVSAPLNCVEGVPPVRE